MCNASVQPAGASAVDDEQLGRAMGGPDKVYVWSDICNAMKASAAFMTWRRASQACGVVALASALWWADSMF